MKEHKWRDGPILLLPRVETWGFRPAYWHGPVSKSFDPDFVNVLRLHFTYQWKKPWGGMASFRVIIDRLVGLDWERVHTIERHFFPSSDALERADELYDLRHVIGILDLGKTTRMKFRIGYQVEHRYAVREWAGGHWTPTDLGEYTAVFKPLRKSPKFRDKAVDYLRLLEQGISQFKKECGITRRK